MKAVLLAVLLGAVWVAGQSPQALFARFMSDYHKQYRTSAEQQYRFGIFIQNLNLAAERNNQSDGSVHGVTKFMDLTSQEFAAQYMGFTASAHGGGGSGGTTTASNVVAPTALPTAEQCTSTTTCNWSSQGATTPVKDQGQCGSCWAFSAVEQIETAWYFGHYPNPIVSLSPQQITSCDTGDGGCNGGNTETAYNYVISSGGVELATDYPYTSGTNGVTGTCSFDSTKVNAKISAWKYAINPCQSSTCKSQSESALLGYVQKSGPLSICIYAAPWQTYRSGIMKTCSSNAYQMDHCAQLVGYGTQSGSKYWLVRNQWGVNWGESGYIRLAYGSNVCGMANDVTYVIPNLS